MPYCTTHGGEVFEYPAKLLSRIEKALPPEVGGMTPYGYASYAEYYSYVDELTARFGMAADGLNALGRNLQRYKCVVQRMNVKEDWSICLYTGSTTDNTFGLTHGRYYYWPCSCECPEFGGVIDNEEFTSYPYSAVPELWEIAQDPLGMARRTLDKDFDWKTWWHKSAIE